MNAHSPTIEQADDHYRAVISSAHSSSEERIAATQALRAAKIAAETTAERAARLEREARDHDDHANDLDAEAAQDDLVVTVRRARQGDGDQTAANIAARAQAHRDHAADCRAEAVRKRSQAQAIRGASAEAA